MPLSDKQRETLLLVWSGEWDLDADPGLTDWIHTDPEARAYLESLDQIRQGVRLLDQPPPRQSPLLLALEKLDVTVHATSPTRKPGWSKTGSGSHNGWGHLISIGFAMAALVLLGAVVVISNPWESPERKIVEGSSTNHSRPAIASFTQQSIVRIVREPRHTTRERIRSARTRLQSFKQPMKRVGVLRNEI